MRVVQVIQVSLEHCTSLSGDRFLGTQRSHELGVQYASRCFSSGSRCKVVYVREPHLSFGSLVRVAGVVDVSVERDQSLLGNRLRSQQGSHVLQVRSTSLSLASGR
ncbi:hypothetical protein D3C87_1515890 [compost metagenome]